MGAQLAAAQWPQGAGWTAREFVAPVKSSLLVRGRATSAFLAALASVLCNSEWLLCVGLTDAAARLTLKLRDAVYPGGHRQLLERCPDVFAAYDHSTECYLSYCSSPARIGCVSGARSYSRWSGLSGIRPIAGYLSGYRGASACYRSISNHASCPVPPHLENDERLVLSRPPSLAI